jgi:hypothetical protein
MSRAIVQPRQATPGRASWQNKADWKNAGWQNKAQKPNDINGRWFP